MAANVSEQHRRRWAALGLGMIAPDEGMRAMRDLMLSGKTPQAAVLPLTVSKLQTTSPFYSELMRSAGPSKTAAASSATTNPAHEDIHKRVNDAGEGERTPVVVAFLGEQLVRVLALDPSYRVDPHRSIMEMGLDSLMAMELRNRVETNLRVTVSVADLLLGPSVQQLAESIVRNFVVAGDASGVTKALDDAALLAELDTMSEEDLDAQLERLLVNADSGKKETRR
jgi:aryl carrier-like protein